MISQLSQEAMTEYASNAQTIQEPTGADYSRGVAVGRTIPAKWWNWLFRASTKRIEQSRNDAQNMLSELQNVVTDAGITLDSSDTTQLRQAVKIDAAEQIDAYVSTKNAPFSTWEPLDIYLDDVLQSTCSVSSVIKNVNGKYFALLSRLVGVSTSRAFARSDDLVHWYTISDPVSTYAYRSGMVDVVYFNNAWFILVASYSTSNNGYSLWVSRTTDFVTGTNVIKISVTDNYVQAPFMAVIEGKLFVYKGTGGTPMSVSTTGTEWTSIAVPALTETFHNSYGINELIWNTTGCAKLSGTKYLVAGAIYDTSNDTWTSLIKTVTGNSTIVGQLSNSSAVVRTKIYSDGATITRTYIILSDGTLSSLSVDNYTYVGQLNGTSYAYSRYIGITSDGINTIDFSAVANYLGIRDIHVVAITATKFILKGNSDNGTQTAVSDSVSTNGEDYVLYPLNVTGALIWGNYGDYLVSEDPFAGKFTRDFGVTESIGHLTTGSVGVSPIQFTFREGLYAIMQEGSSAGAWRICKALARANYVAGHTLYIV